MLMKTIALFVGLVAPVITFIHCDDLREEGTTPYSSPYSSASPGGGLSISEIAAARDRLDEKERKKLAKTIERETSGVGGRTAASGDEIEPQPIEENHPTD